MGIMWGGIVVQLEANIFSTHIYMYYQGMQMNFMQVKALEIGLRVARTNESPSKLSELMNKKSELFLKEIIRFI